MDKSIWYPDPLLPSVHTKVLKAKGGGSGGVCPIWEYSNVWERDPDTRLWIKIQEILTISLGSS